MMQNMLVELYVELEMNNNLTQKLKTYFYLSIINNSREQIKILKTNLARNFPPNIIINYCKNTKEK